MEKEFRTKFRKSMGIIQDAVERNVDLDHQHPKLYKKILKFYEEQGVTFYDDPVEDYYLVLECLGKELMEVV